MPNYIFDDFAEVEETVRKLAPSIIYKYRGDWNNNNHKEFITRQKIWLASPKELNDPYDIRTPVKFDISEIEHPEFYRKLKEYLKISYLHLSSNEEELRRICDAKMIEIRKDPKAYFEKNYKYIRESKIFDQVGVFSCTSDELNEAMWAHYGNNHTGFAVGFNTVELARDLRCGFGPVNYNNETPTHSFINRDDFDLSSLYLKSKQWENEKEFRFITIGIEDETERIKIYPLKSIAEFLIGNNFPKELVQDFLNEIRKIYSKEIPVYQIKPKISDFGLEKYRID